MNVKNAVFIYFSPTYTTKKVLQIMKDTMNLPSEEIDLTDIPATPISYQFDDTSLVVLGIPVYGGRVPKTALERFESIKGNNTPIVLVATYGNRDYDDALLELKTVMEQKGFSAVSAAAVVTEHSIVHSIAVGRPNDEDIAFIEDFAEKSIQKLHNTTSLDALTVKGNENYRKYQTIPISPHSTEKCRGCGLCARKCPVGAIPFDAPHKTNKEICISCMRCIKVCTSNARELHKLELIGAKQMISMKCKEDKKPEMFI